jgi:hypothetical protein
MMAAITALPAERFDLRTLPWLLASQRGMTRLLCGSMFRAHNNVAVVTWGGSIMRLSILARYSLIVIAAIVTVGSAIAQSADEKPVIERATLWTIKPGMGSKFEAGLKRHNQFHVKQGDTQSHDTYTIESGGNTGSYWRVAGNRHWEDFDAEEKFGEADTADSDVNLSPYIESSMPMFFEFLVDVSNPGPEGAPVPAMYELNFFRIKAGHYDQFSLAMKKVKDAAVKVSWTENWAWLVLVNGGEHDQFVLALPRDNWADFNPPQKPFPKMLEEALGKAEAEAVFKMFDDSIASSRSEIVRYRADLSYTPAKK